MWKRGAPNWNQVDIGVLDEALSTGRTVALRREQMPSWTQDFTQVTGAWLRYEGGVPLDSTSGLSTTVAQAELIVERQHAEAPQFRYDRHLFVKMADGRVFQAGPYKGRGLWPSPRCKASMARQVLPGIHVRPNCSQASEWTFGAPWARGHQPDRQTR